jgi:hypothetical protein
MRCCFWLTLTIITHTLLPFLTLPAIGQTNVSGNLQSYINSFIDSMPRTVGGNQYQPPSGSQLARFGQAMLWITQGNTRSADSVSATIGYKVVVFTDTANAQQRLFYVLEKDHSSTNHWGTIIIAASAERPNLVIQCPHPIHDSQTGKQGIYVFIRTGAFAFMLSGTQRCNNLTATPCTGATTACTGANDPYPISDQAHVVNSTFQRTTEALNSRNPLSVFVQLHGFAQAAGDPDVIMSNGTRSTPINDNVAAIRNGLLQEDPTLTFKIPHIDLSWTKLTAFVNTQGRYLNNSSDPCVSNATASSGRFVHIEQVYDNLRSSEVNWNKMVNALSRAFLTDVGDEVGYPGSSLLLQNYPNPFNPSTTIPFVVSQTGVVALRVYDLLGREIASLANGTMSPGYYQVQFDGSSQASGVYAYKLTTPTSLVVRRMVLVR